ncbi:hypothetical protein BXZ70DRAFT_677297 [Cristinia sonorae]|uniref:Uncharacterized protein n=1 Tax=Cristinia sonorae TaxID=1940300 RepID=A0A8K0XT73_9AGAR|nr:hypothetical protein BXZ70DRAFT_677297 [Cristinia sonorae]
MSFPVPRSPSQSSSPQIYKNLARQISSMARQRRKNPKPKSVKCPPYAALVFDTMYDLARSNSFGPQPFDRSLVYQRVVHKMSVMGKALTRATRRLIEDAMDNGAVQKLYFFPNQTQIQLLAKGRERARESRRFNREIKFSDDKSRYMARGYASNSILKPFNATKKQVIQQYIALQNRYEPPPQPRVLQAWSSVSTMEDEDMREVEEALATPRAQSPAEEQHEQDPDMVIDTHSLPSVPQTSGSTPTTSRVHSSSVAGAAAAAYPSPQSAPRPSRGLPSRTRVPETPLAGPSRLRVEDVPELNHASAGYLDDMEHYDPQPFQTPVVNRSQSESFRFVPPTPPSPSPPSRTVSRTLQASTSQAAVQEEEIRLRAKLEADQLRITELEDQLRMERSTTATANSTWGIERAGYQARVRNLEEELKSVERERDEVVAELETLQGAVQGLAAFSSGLGLNRLPRR